MENSKLQLLGKLRCPCCNEEFEISDNEKSLVCKSEKKHCFDFSSAGYVNLSRGNQMGDLKDSVKSRSKFLDLGAYEKVSDKINELLKELLQKGSTVVDAGCGEGYYSCRICKEGFNIIGFDLSKDGITVASKRAKREKVESAFFAVASIFDMPLKDSSADGIVNIFAPCAEEEYSRVLKNGGILLVAYAGKDHLMGLKKALYKDVYENKERMDMPVKMELLSETRVKYKIELTKNEDILNLFSMTPYYWRTSVSDKEKLSGLEYLETDVDVIIVAYKNKKIGG